MKTTLNLWFVFALLWNLYHLNLADPTLKRGPKNHRDHRAKVGGGKGLYVLPVSNEAVPIPAPWTDIPMPKKSYFAGFSPPTDELKWNQASLQASRGEQVLLSKIMEVIKSPFDLIQADGNFKWIHRMSEHQRSKDVNWLNDIPATRPSKAPVVMFGYRKFTHESKSVPRRSVLAMLFLKFIYGILKS